MTTCSHPADKASTTTLLMACPDCGAECSGDQVGDDDLCYDQACPLHVMAGEIAEPATTYAIKWNHGLTETGFATVADAEAAVRSVLSGATIGHSGDIADGGERTLFWASEEDAANDDGSRAKGAIQARHAEVR